MNERFFDPGSAFENSVVLAISASIILILVISGLVVFFINGRPGTDEKLKRDLVLRFRSWLILAPLMVAPILIGPIPTIMAVAILSLLAHREFARATGLFRYTVTSLCVVFGILLIMFANADNWYGLFAASIPLSIVIIAGLNVFPDHPDGYLQRVALGMLSFGLFGSAMGHLGMIANDVNYRAILLWLIFCVQINDVFAYTSGKLIGRRKLLPNTSPGKTLGGALGALVLTTIASCVMVPHIFPNSVLSQPVHAITLGLLISILGQLGDLVISSIKRDVGIKDMGQLFPGHGGILDRFDSLILAAPAVFHYIHYYLGIADGQPVRIFSGASG